MLDEQAQTQTACVTISLVILGLGVLGLVIKAAVSSAVPTPPRAPTQRPQPARPPVAMADGPGRYRVDGVDRTSRMDVTLYISAASREAARVKADLDGVTATRIEKAIL